MTNINLTSYDPDELKASLIEFYQSRPGFEDINYEGSAINTIIDNLVRNTHYIAYMANMVATESFLDSAQIRSNIVSHAQKLSYTPKSRTASTIVCNLTVIPSVVPTLPSIVAPKGSVFTNTVGGVAYTFVTLEDTVLTLNSSGRYVAFDVELKQGGLSREQFLYNRLLGKVTISNKDIDTSTLRVFYRPSQSSLSRTEMQVNTNITNLDSDSSVYFLHENTRGQYDIEFGKDILGFEPADLSVIEVEYIVTETDHANGLSTVFAATSIGGFANIVVDVTVPAYGGSEKASNSMIKFLAPKIYETQERAVKAQDFSSLMLRDFPFLKSAIAWGGEDNIPPYYGRVFLSAVPQEGFIIVDSIKSVIQNRMKRYSMLETEVVDVEYIDVDLSVGIIYSQSKTNKTFTQLSSEINNVINSYKDEIKTFDKWFNNSALVGKIKSSVPAVESIEIVPSMKIQGENQPARNALYVLNFNNKIVPKTFEINNIKLDVFATTSRIYDDGEGNILSKTTINNVDRVETIGSINYETGNISFSVMFIDNGNFTAKAKSATDNVYTSRNNVVNIDQVSTYVMRPGS
jgi:hypothetical protein